MTKHSWLYWTISQSENLPMYKFLAGNGEEYVIDAAYTYLNHKTENNFAALIETIKSVYSIAHRAALKWAIQLIILLA